MEIFGNILSKVTDDDIVNGTFIIPDTIEYIDAEAFKDCDFLKFVKLPNSVRSIGVGAFENCIHLKNIEMSNNISYIRKRAFLNCKELTNITIPENVCVIESEVFSGCNSLKRVNILGNLTKIKESAFAKCYKLKKLCISKNIVFIDKYAFSDCPKLHLKLETSLFIFLCSGLVFKKLEVYDGYITGRSASIDTDPIYGVYYNKPHKSNIIRFIYDTRKRELFDIIKSKLHENNIRKRKYLQYNEHKKFINEILTKFDEKERENFFNQSYLDMINLDFAENIDYMLELEIDNYVKKYIKSCVATKDIKSFGTNDVDDRMFFSQTNENLSENIIDNTDVTSNSISIDDDSSSVMPYNIVGANDVDIKNISVDMVEQENPTNVEKINYQNIFQMLSELPNDEIALIRDMVKNAFLDENIVKYIHMSREEKLAFLKNQSQELTKAYKVSLAKEPIEVYKERQKQKGKK